MAPELEPIFEVTRGRLVESQHFGAIAIVDASGKLLFHYGDPQLVSFLRSSAKPFQAMPFFEYGGPEALGLDLYERAVICASHEGSQDHIRVVRGLLGKAGVEEGALLCGAHWPGDPTSFRGLIRADANPAPIHNNCSGKHSGLLAAAKLRGLPLETYLESNHPLQQEILERMSLMSGTPASRIETGIDGCSAPNFALSLFAAALAYARLCDPRDLDATKQRAVREITDAMTGAPEMISGDEEFDCQLMRTAKGRVVCKRGAEGFQTLGLMPGTMPRVERGVGIAFKIADGDPSSRGADLQPRNRVRPAVTLEILSQLGVLSSAELGELVEFGPVTPIRNFCNTRVGEARTTFQLKRSIVH